MSLYEDNLKFTKKYYPELFSVIGNDNDDPEGVVEPSTTRSQEPNLIIDKDGSTYYLHSKYNAVEEAKKWANTLGKQLHSEHILIIGCGLGYYLEQLIERSASSYIYVYEPDPKIFNAWLKLRDVRQVLANRRIRLFVVGEDELLQTRLAMYISEYSKNELSIIYAPVYSKLFSSVIDGIHHKIKKMLYAQSVNQVTLQTFEKEWITNVLYNLPYVVTSTSASMIKGTNKGMTAIVVGSGPSLKYDIHYLKQLKSSCFIIAAGSSIQALDDFGVYPHLVVSIDGGISNYRVFQNVDTRQSPLLSCSFINFNILEQYRGPVISATLSNDLITSNICNKMEFPVFRSSTSVTGIALQVAAYMGASQIVLMGQDLSYPDKQFYFSGVKHATEEYITEQLKDATEWVPNVDGGHNPTTLKMKATLNDIELQIQLTALDGVRIINSSRHGAVISGAEWIPMDELASNLNASLRNNINQLREYVQEITDEERLTNLMELKKEYLLLNSEVNYTEKKIKQLLLTISNLEGKMPNGEIKTISKHLFEINKLWTQITRQRAFELLYSFSLKHCINDYMRHVPDIVENSDARKKARLIVNHLGMLVNKMHEFTPELIKIIKYAMKRLDNIIDKLGDLSNERTI